MAELPLIVHLDADAFFVACEQAKDPTLLGKVCAVGGRERGIIASASYEARAKGVYTPMPTSKALKLLTEYALIGQGFSPQLAWHMFLMKWCHDNGYFFIGGHEDIDFVLKDGEYFSKDFQRDLSTQNFVDKFGLDGINRFWKQDSRLMASFLKLSTVQQLMKEKVEILVEHKVKYFSEIFPDIEERPKFTGFERIQEWDAILRTYMKKFNLQYDDISYVPASFFMQEENR